MAKSNFKVQDYALQFDGELYAAGDTVEMDEDAAAPLVEAGRLKKTAAQAKEPKKGAGGKDADNGSGKSQTG